MKIIYREALEEDAYGFEYVAANSWKDTYWDLLPQTLLENRIKRLDNKEELEIKLSSIRQHIENNKGKIFVALREEKVIGILEVNDNNEKYPEYGHLGAIYVLPEYKGNGIGKKLFLIALEKLNNLGFDNIELECMKGNQTIDFYKKFGGVIIDTVKQEIYGVDVDVDIVIFKNIKDILEKNNIQK